MKGRRIEIELQKIAPKKVSIDIGKKIRKEFSKAYMLWTKFRDEIIKKFFMERRSVRKLAKFFERKEDAI